MVKISVVFLFCSMLSSCKPGSSDDADTGEEAEAVAVVKAVHPQQQMLSDSLQLSGTTAYLDKVEILSPVSGYVKSIEVNVGDMLAPGQTVAVMQTREAAAYARAGIDSLAKKGLIPVRVLFRYIVTDIPEQAGDYVQEGAKLMSVVDPSSVVISLRVPYEDNEAFQTGKRCTVEFPDKKIMTATVWKRIPTVDSSSQTLQCLLKVNAVHMLPENLNVIVHASRSSPRIATVLPESAILTDETQSEFWVMKMMNDSTAVKLTVRPGIQYHRMTEILSPPLDTGDLFLSEGNYGLNDTSRVSLQ